MGLEELRNLHLKSVKGTPVSTEDEGDWPREFYREYPYANQIRNWVREEFLNRWRNIGFKYTEDGEQLNTMDNPRGLLAMQNPEELPDWDRDLYKGPKTAWVRMTSNIIAPSPSNPEKIFKGFILQGNGNFHDTYGFDRGNGDGGGGDAETLLGYDQSTPPQRHTIQEPDYKHRPTPGIVSVESEDLNPMSGMRRTTVNFVCWSVAQLDYLEVYFFAPGKSVSVEWGWNNFPKDSLLPLNDDGIQKRVNIWNNANVDGYDKFGPKPGAASKHTRNGRGNYSWIMGLITKFGYTVREDGGYDCNIQIQAPADLSRFIMQSNSAIEKKKGSPQIYTDFIHHTLPRLLVGTSNADYTAMRTDDKQIQDVEKQALNYSRGRFFSFDSYGSSKPYYASNTNAGGSYITIGFFIDTINLFFGRASGTGATLCEFSCWNSRAVAHFNIKSTDGSVLLIPNSLAPRWNAETLPGLQKISSVGAESDPDKEPHAYNILKRGETDGMYSSVTNSFLEMVNSAFPSGSPAQSIDEALRKSPRDNLHKYLSDQASGGYNLQHPLLAGKLNTENRQIVNTGNPTEKLKAAWENPEDTVRPFPDFEPTLNTEGYSGRIADLFVNINVIKEAVSNNSAPHEIIMDVMQKVSAAANNIWDFRLIGGDPNTSTPTILQLIDANYTGSKPVHKLKEKAWVFPVHRGDSIIRAMDLSNELSNEMATVAALGDSTDTETNKQVVRFYNQGRQDLIFGEVIKQSNLDTTKQSLVDSAQETENIPDSEKYIIAQSTNGFKRGEIFKFTKYKEDPDLKGTTTKVSMEGLFNSTPKEKTVKKTFWISFIDKNGKKQVLEANNEHQRKIQVERAINGYGVKESDIQFAPGSQWSGLDDDSDSTLKKFGSSAERPVDPKTGVGSIGQKRIHKIWVDDDWIQDENNFTRGWKGLDGPITDDSQIKKLIGRYIKYQDNSDVDHDKENPPKSGKEYKIISSSIPRDTEGNYSDVETSGWDQPYVLHIEELKGTLLSKGDIKRFQDATYSGRPVPNDIKRFMSDNNLNESDVATQQTIKYNSSDSSKSAMSVETRKISDQTYGTGSDGYEIDIEMVDPDKERMLKYCTIDDNAKNNLIFNFTDTNHQLSLTLDGIEGLRLYDIFDCSGVPTKFYMHGTYMITEIKHSVANGDWQTTITSNWVIGKSEQIIGAKK